MIPSPSPIDAHASPKYNELDETVPVDTQVQNAYDEFREVEIADMQFISEADFRRATYETEPNNAMSSANTIYNDGTMYGRIASVGDEDYYKVSFPYSGNANFWLGDIPNGTNYDLYLYNSAGSLLTSSTSDTVQELIYHYSVSANTLYYLRVCSNDDSFDASNYYRIRAKCYVAKNARIFYDSSCAYSASQLNSLYASATAPFVTEFNIEFCLASTSRSYLLNGASCPNTATSEICKPPVCGVKIDCSSTHHKGAGRLYAINSSSQYYTYNFVGHPLCYYQFNNGVGSHISVIGLGSVGGKNALTSVYSSPNKICSIQHELSHNLGCSHGTCVPGELCVLKGNQDVWCSSCKSTIENSRIGG